MTAPVAPRPAPVAPRPAPAQPEPVPGFAAPTYRERATRHGTAVAVRRVGTGELTEGRLLFPLSSPPGPHQTRVEVTAEALRDALTEAAADLATVRVEARSDRAVIAVRTFADDFAATCTRIRDCLDAVQAAHGPAGARGGRPRRPAADRRRTGTRAARPHRLPRRRLRPAPLRPGRDRCRCGRGG
ncbi:hypothetical protein ACQ4WX_01720 [Streptomyces lasalocidi]